MKNARLIAGFFIIFIGLSILFDIPVFKVLIPVFLIVFGLRVITGKNFGFSETGRKEETEENTLKRVLIFSGINKEVVSDSFEGGEVVAVFGGGEIDLRRVKTKRDRIEMDLVAVFGGLKVYIPATWNVKSEGVGIVGAFNNQTKLSGKKTTDFVVQGVAIFGGVDVVNS